VVKDNTVVKDNIVVKPKRTQRQTIVDKILHRNLIRLRNTNSTKTPEWTRLLLKVNSTFTFRSNRVHPGVLVKFTFMSNRVHPGVLVEFIFRSNRVHPGVIVEFTLTIVDKILHRNLIRLRNTNSTKTPEWNRLLLKVNSTKTPE
jgi:hypothetical protein